MSATVELLPVTRLLPNAGGVGLGATEYLQPTDTIVGVAGYREAMLLMVVHDLSFGMGMTLTVSLQTALDNREDHYVELAELVQYSSFSPPTPPDKTSVYLGQSTSGSSTAPGFGRFLRLHVAGGSAWTLTVGVKLLMKP